MAYTPLKNDLSLSDEIDIRERSLFARLKKLFSSGTIVRNIGGKKLKVIDTDNTMIGTSQNSIRDRFNRVRSTGYNSYTRDFALAYQAARIDLFRDYDTMDLDPIISCLSSDTYIATLNGFVTIMELSKKYSNGEPFQVWAWDKDKQKLTIGNAHHPRKTGTKNVIEIHLDTGEVLKCTKDHRIMLIDGTYKEAGKLSAGDSLMPFYNRINKHSGYQEIKSLGGRFKYAHRYIFEDVLEQNVGNDNIHHKNRNRLDNRLENLKRMTAVEHCKLHGIDVSTNQDRSCSCKKLWDNDNYRIAALSGIKKFQGSEIGKKIMSENTSLLNKKRWKNNKEYALKMSSIFSKHAKSLWADPEWKEWKRKKHSETIKLKFANDPTYVEKIKRVGKENGRYNPLITTESILIGGINYASLIDFARSFDFKGIPFKNDQYRCQFISRRLKRAGYKTWTDYKNKFEHFNHKVSCIVDNNEITDVYDLTVDIYENFAIKQGIIVSNSALDIYSEESVTPNEMGEILVVHSDDSNVKDILNNLFYDILNIQFNLWSWVRNMVKYGDFYLRLYISPTYGVYFAEPICAYNVERIENSDSLNKNYVKFQIRPTDTSQAETLEEFEMVHFRLLSDSNFAPYGKGMLEGVRRIWKQLCLSGDTNIWTKDGVKLLKNIEVGDVVYSFDYNNNKTITSRVVNKAMTGTRKTYEIKTEHRTLYATKEHPLMVRDGSYKQVKDLTIDDYLVLPNINDDVGAVEYPKLMVEESSDFSFDKKLKILDDNIIKDNFKEFLRFFGFMLGDGWLDTHSVAFCLGDRIDKSQKYVDFVNKLNLSCSISEENTTSAYCRVYSLYFVKLMEQLGFLTGSSNKKIPHWVWKLPSSYKKEILLGFADADGCDRDENTFQLSSINETLIRDLREIAMQCGLSTTKIWQTETDGCTGKLCKMTCFTYKLKSRDFIKINDGYHIEKIRSIIEGEKEDVYDIQVDNDIHNFIANGVVVHNCLMEDAMLIHRIMRAPEKRIFKVDIGNIPPNEVDSYMEKLISKMKKVPYIDQRTGDYNLRFNLQNMVEDFFLPVRGSDSGNSIENLSGMEWTGIDDIEYLRNKLLAGLKIPKAFLTYDESLSGKATLSQEDLRFARTVNRIQNFIVSGLGHIARVHLYAQGYRDEDLVNFTLDLTNPSVVFEKEKVALWSEKIDVAKSMFENKLFSKKWVYTQLFDVSDEDVDRIDKEMIEDAKQLYRYKSIEEDGNDPAQPFKKIKPDSGEKESPGGPEGGPEGMPELGGEPPGEAGGAGGPEAAGGGEADLASALKEVHGEPADDYERPSQKGEKDASDYPLGEDPLGYKENDAKPRKRSSVVHHWKNGSPFDIGTLSERLVVKPADEELALRTRKSSIITSLDAYLKTSAKSVICENLESTGSSENTEKPKTFLDEDNIIES